MAGRSPTVGRNDDSPMGLLLKGLLLRDDPGPSTNPGSKTLSAGRRTRLWGFLVSRIRVDPLVRGRNQSRRELLNSVDGTSLFYSWMAGMMVGATLVLASFVFNSNAYGMKPARFQQYSLREVSAPLVPDKCYRRDVVARQRYIPIWRLYKP